MDNWNIFLPSCLQLARNIGEPIKSDPEKVDICIQILSSSGLIVCALVTQRLLHAEDNAFALSAGDFSTREALCSAVRGSVDGRLWPSAVWRSFDAGAKSALPSQDPDERHLITRTVRSQVCFDTFPY